mmetsp:Transcript_77160/g.213280  ORF Transcript_77160/g.213280 Transcript_77160/m.213280 type:complete len:243 (+) Transcript_77160:371-1099(+)
MASQSPRLAKMNLCCISFGIILRAKPIKRMPGSRLKTRTLPRSSGYCWAVRTMILSLPRAALDVKSCDQLKPSASRASTTRAMRLSRRLWLCSAKLRISQQERNHSSKSSSSRFPKPSRLTCPRVMREMDMPSFEPSRAGNCSIEKFLSIRAAFAVLAASKSSMPGGRRSRIRVSAARCSRRKRRCARRACGACGPWPRRKRQSIKSCCMSSGSAASCLHSWGSRPARSSRTCASSSGLIHA